MRRPNREVTIFNLSMLDVMTGALGAVMIVMIVLLTQKIGEESMSCQDIKTELSTTSQELVASREKLETTQKELEQSKTVQEASLGKIEQVTRMINSTVENVKSTVNKISTVQKELFAPKPGEEEVMAFKIPKKIVMAIDLSGSMDAKNNKYKEDRLSQVKAALKMFIAGMGGDYRVDIVFFPAFPGNIDKEKCPGFSIKPVLSKKCLDFDLKDEAYDTRGLSCYKFGYFEGALKPMASAANKYAFYKKIACLKAYHDTPTATALEYVLSADMYKDAHGIILFSDGRPDSVRKEYITTTELLKTIQTKNKDKKKIFTVGIGTEFRNQEDSEAVDFLKKLAEQNNGFYIGF
ncbi:MAG: hypothetical protein GY754_25240 [bacterium]|nr:hypothetical protein [bacterium]